MFDQSINQNMCSCCISTMSLNYLERESNIVCGWKSIKLQHHQQRRHISDFPTSPLCLSSSFLGLWWSFKLAKPRWQEITSWTSPLQHIGGLSLRIYQPCKTLHVNWGKLSILFPSGAFELKNQSQMWQKTSKFAPCMSSNCFSNLKYDGIAYLKIFQGVTIKFFILGQKNCSARPRGVRPTQPQMV